MKVLLVAVVGSGNFGDEAMFKAVYKTLIDRRYEITVTTYEVERAKNRFQDIRFIKLSALSKKEYIQGFLGKDVLDIDVSNFDSLYVSGGGNLNSLYPSHVFNVYLIAKKFKKKGKYVEFRPQSVGPFFGRNKAVVEFLVNRIVRIPDTFYVRELLSYEYLRRKHQKIKLSRDDAWNIPIDESVKLTNEKYVGLCIRPWKDGEILVSYIRNLTIYLQKHGYVPLFIPIAYEGSEKYIDNSFLKGKVPGIFLDDLVKIDTLTPEMIKGVIKKCCFTVGMSYHFSVFSLSTGVPSAAIYLDDYYKIKNLGLYKAFGNPELVFKVPEISSEQLIDRVMKTLKD